MNENKFQKTVNLKKTLKIDDSNIDKIELNYEGMTGADILAIDMELRASGITTGFSTIHDHDALLLLSSRASGIIADDLRKLNAVDFLEVIMTTRNFFIGL